MRSCRHAVAFALIAAVLPRADGEEAAGSPDATYAIGDTVEDGLGKDLDGALVRLSDLAVTKPRAWAAVSRAADVFGAAGGARPGTTFADLAALAGGGEMAAADREALVGEAGRAFGLLAHPDRVRRMTTLGDVAAWIESCARAPVVVVAWSPSCKTCRNGADEYLNGLVAETGARLVVLAPGFGGADTEEEVRAYLDAKPWCWRVVPDADRTLTERFGATLTPHAFVLDAARVLRYRGALYRATDDAEGSAPREHLRETIAALASGRPVPVASTEPLGCPLPRRAAR
jgi:hypothetical protein